MKKFATLSKCGTYRYWLERVWSESADTNGKGFVNFVMLNPSTADAEKDDPTIRRCIGFAKLWGYDALHVVNLFALRATNPEELCTHRCPIGPDNDQFIEAGMLSADKTVFAWGSFHWAAGRALQVAKMFVGQKNPPMCLGMCKDGNPRHPLYVRADAELIPWNPNAYAKGRK